MSGSDELKPCPFCGGDATEGPVFVTGKPSGDISWVGCVPCGVFVNFTHGERGRGEAVRAWNTRAAVVHDGRAWQVVRECEWRPEHDGENFTTECGAMFFWEPPTPLHCPCCGGRVKVVG